MVDGWMGDDWFHYGAFRQQGMPYIFEQEATRKNDVKWWRGQLRRLRHVPERGVGGGPREAPRARAGRILAQDPRAPELRRLLAATRRSTSSWRRSRSTCRCSSSTASGTRRTSTAGSRSTRRSSRRTRATTKSSWRWGRGITARRSGTARLSGRLKFNSDTALTFRQEVLRPFLAQYLKDGAPKADIAAVTAFETGYEHLAKAPGLARRMRQRLHGQADAAVPRRRRQGRLRRADSRRAPSSPNTSPTRQSPFRIGLAP